MISHLWKTGDVLWPRLQEILDARGIPCRIRGLPVCPSIGFEARETRDSFFRACYRNGISLYDVPYVTWSHRPADVVEALERFAKAAGEL